MNRIDANAFATNWIRAWNKKDVDAVLEHYVEDAPENHLQSVSKLRQMKLFMKFDKCS